MFVHGFDAEAGEFIIEILPSQEIRRSVQDLMRLNRLLRKIDKKSSNLLGMPTKPIKLLSSRGSWRVYHEGWHIELSKSIRVIESWLHQLKTLGDFKEFTDDRCHEATKSRLRKRASEIVRSKHLQQYFCSEKNMRILIDIATNGLLKTEYVALEPSCGDGRILREIMARAGFPALGCDIDPVIVNKARALTSASVPILLSNFLSLSASMFRSAFDFNVADKRVVVIGCPPFSAFSCSGHCGSRSGGGGETCDTNNDAEEKGAPRGDGRASHRACVRDNTRDILLDFFRHCGGGKHESDANALRSLGLELDIRRIAWLLPARCASPAFIAAARAALNGTETQCLGSDLDVEASMQQRNWQLVVNIAADSHFQIVSEIVKQPAIIQLWEQRE